MTEKKIKRYSESFKCQVVAEYEAGSSLPALAKKYGITGGPTIKLWIKKYAREGFRHELVRIQAAEEANRVKELEQQVHPQNLSLLHYFFDIYYRRYYLELVLSPK